MPRRRTYTRECAHPRCPERSHIEYTARHDLEGISPTWKCIRHSKPNEVLSADNPTTTAVLVNHRNYHTSRRSGEEPQFLGLFWGPEDAERGCSGIELGPGFRAISEDLPPGTRLIVTARIELPSEQPKGAA